jgi:endonuclease-8
MPEGDTIHKLAGVLSQALHGVSLAAVYLRDRGEIAALRGARVERVQAVGKHMIIAFSDDRGLRVHLGMKGRWRRYPRAAADQDQGAAAWMHLGTRLGARASLVLATDSDAFACLDAAQVELLAGVDLRRHRVLARLGPDLLAGSEAGPEAGPEAKPDAKIDFAEICRRARRSGHQTIAELLLDQTVASGIGNVYRSEVLFVQGVHPLTPVAQLDDQALTALYAEAARLMRANLRSGHRITTVAPERRRQAGPGGVPHHWVYGRHHQPCLRCGTIIRVTRHGDQARTTYWCPRCQPAPGS